MPDVGELERILDDIIRDDERASELIERVRASVKKRPFRPERLDPNDVIRSSVRLTRTLAARENVTVVVGANEDLPMVMGDRIQLEQVLMNLILNGVDAMRDAATRRLEISGASIDGGFVQICVSDTGTGAHGRDLDMLFQSFYTTKPTGVGLGLAISRSIVEAHGGKIWATENSDRGLTFNLTIPNESSTTRKRLEGVSGGRKTSAGSGE